MRTFFAFLAIAGLSGCGLASADQETPTGYVWAGKLHEELVVSLRAAGLEGSGCQVRWLTSKFPEWEHAMPPAATLDVILAGAVEAC